MADILRVALLVALNALVYGRTVNYDLVMDDWQWYTRRRRLGFTRLSAVRSAEGLQAWVHERLYSGTTFGTNPRVERCFAICLHALICALMYLAFGRDDVSFAAALLYAVHPLNNQTSIWLNGRRYALNVIAVLLMVMFPLASLALYPFTLSLQVTAVFSPVLLAARSPWFLSLIPAVLLVAGPAILEKIRLRAGAMAEGDLRTWRWSRLIVIVKTFGFFFWKMLVPGVCAMQYPDRIDWGKNEEGNRDAYAIDKAFGFGALALFLCAVGVALLPGSYKAMAAFLVLSTVQWSAVLPVTQILSDRYMSLPNVFMMFFVAYFSQKLGGLSWYFTALLGCYYALCLSELFPMYESLNSWYEYHFAHFPGLSWLRGNLVSDLMNEGKFAHAQLQAIEGLARDKKDFRLLMQAAVLHARQGAFKEAEEFIGEAEKNFYLNMSVPQSAEVKALRGQIRAIRFAAGANAFARKPSGRKR